MNQTSRSVKNLDIEIINIRIGKNVGTDLINESTEIRRGDLKWQHVRRARGKVL